MILIHQCLRQSAACAVIKGLDSFGFAGGSSIVFYVKTPDRIRRRILPFWLPTYCRMVPQYVGFSSVSSYPEKNKPEHPNVLNTSDTHNTGTALLNTRVHTGMGCTPVWAMELAWSMWGNTHAVGICSPPSQPACVLDTQPCTQHKAQASYLSIECCAITLAGNAQVAAVSACGRNTSQVQGQLAILSPTCSITSGPASRPGLSLVLTGDQAALDDSHSLMVVCADMSRPSRLGRP